MRNTFPPFHMKVILDQVVKSRLRSLLDSFLGCRKIKVKEADAYKTIRISYWGNMTYKYLFFGLPDTSIAFKRPIHTTFDELVNIHLYLDDLIVYVKQLIITSGFQVLFQGPFKIDFVFDANSHILKDL